MNIDPENLAQGMCVNPKCRRELNPYAQSSYLVISYPDGDFKYVALCDGCFAVPQAPAKAILGRLGFTLGEPGVYGKAQKYRAITATLDGPSLDTVGPYEEDY